MALLEELIITGGGEPMLGAGNAFDKINEIIRVINDNFSGGTAGQYPAKIDGSDFNYGFVDKSVLNWEVFNIGDWDMTTVGFKLVSIGAIDFTKIRLVSIIIREDTDTYHYISPTFNGTGDNVEIAVDQITASGIQLERAIGGKFDTTNFDSTSYNRGFITIGYID